MNETRPNPCLLSDATADLLAEEAKARTLKEQGIAPGPVTGFASLDEELGGYLTPGLHVLLAAPGAGKTAFALQVGAQCGCPCLFVTAEMRVAELVRRVTARVTGTYLGWLRGGKMTEAQLQGVVERAAAACERLAFYDGTETPAVANTIRDAAAAVRGERFDAGHVLLVLDSLTDWAGGGIGGASEEYAATEAALTALKGVALSLPAPVLCVVHRNRAGQRGDAESRLFSGKGTGRIEYISETVINLEPNGEPGADGKTEIILRLLKNRNGQRGKALLFTFEGRLQEFTEVK